LIAVVAGASACGASIVQQRAAFDFGCRESQINRVDAGAGAVGATGCGKKATYIYVGGTGWVRNSEALAAK